MRSNPIKNTEDIGRFIRETRKKQKLTQRDLASLMGAGSRLLTDIERGKPTARVGRILEALDLLGLNVILVERGETNG
jgi:y4mF family transcriptional regulator